MNVEKRIYNLAAVAAVIVILAFGFFGCAGSKHPVDVTYPVLNVANGSWHMANQFAIGLHDLCKVQGESCPFPQIVTKWNEFDDFADQIDAKLELLDAAWLQLGKIESPENLAQVQTLITEINKLFQDVAALIPGLKITQMELSVGRDGKRFVKMVEVENGK